MQRQLSEFILKNEDWLMERLLEYAKQRDFTKYTSTLKEAWRLSISGLSASLVQTLDTKGTDLELHPDEDYVNDPAARFGIIEARLHRDRGVSLAMFLGLMKYYRQAYADLIHESSLESDTRFQYQTIIKRFFDRVEIGFCTEWSSAKDDGILKGLQYKNREMTNEKNKYLTIFESLSLPVFIVDIDGIIENMNHSASRMLDYTDAPGSQYYNKAAAESTLFIEAFPWLKKSFIRFVTGKKDKDAFETAINEKEEFYFVSYSRSLDISGKFTNIIVIIDDITKRKIMEKELEILATTDPLTGAKNRRSFLDIFAKELKRASRYKHPFALLMMDIDRFKKINDTFGHDTGDKVLEILVETSRSMLRDSDVFGRWGGEEFIILLSETDTQQASLTAERLRKKLAELKITAGDGTPFQFTVSIGLTMIKDEKQLIDQLIQKADKALYVAKAQGRNQVVFL